MLSVTKTGIAVAVVLCVAVSYLASEAVFLESESEITPRDVGSYCDLVPPPFLCRNSDTGNTVVYLMEDL